MENIVFDTGIKEFKVNGKGVLRFNPSDPNLFGNFLDATEKIKTVESELVENAKSISANADDQTVGETAVRIMVDADKKVKSILQEVFGKRNDFNEILDGVNLLAVGSNGERVITNLLEAISPIITAGAETCALQKADLAVKEANAKRDTRRNNV